ncbi:dephospho-CoA kinase, partial [Streptomyces niveus]|uniref:dephospho-CoA kinase n=1 Tax=Streptomyces niveus TaxID=193462 RepID=UPI0035D80331
MLKVGLTGGIGAGKSEVSRLLVSYGAVLVDADKIAREVVGPRAPREGSRVDHVWPGVQQHAGGVQPPKLGGRGFAAHENP